MALEKAASLVFSVFVMKLELMQISTGERMENQTNSKFFHV
jgi:hypothetical protein